MRSLSNVRRGSSCILLRRIYVAFVRNHLCYGSIIWGQYSKKSYNQLKSVENTALQCILRARKTSPIVSVDVEDHIMALFLYLLFLFVKWALRLACGPEGEEELPQDLDLYTSTVLGNIFRVLPAILESAGSYLSVPHARVSFLNSLIITMIELDDIELCDPLPGLNEREFTHFHNENHPDYLAIFTDVSRVGDSSVFASMYIPSQSVLGAELMLLCRLRVSQLPKRSQVVVVSDSQSALQVVADTVCPFTVRFHLKYKCCYALIIQ